MRCIYCETDIVDGQIFCPKCGKAVQMVPDYNEFDDDYIDGLVGQTARERAEQKRKQKEALEKKKQLKELEEKNKQKKRFVILSLIVISFFSAIMILVLVNSIKSKNNNSVEYQVKKAHEAIIDNNINEAIDYFNKAIILDSNDISVKLELADLYLNENKSEEAMALYKDVVEIDDNNVVAYQAMIDIYDNKKDYDSILLLSKKNTNKDIEKLFADYIVQPPMFSLGGGEYLDSAKIKITAPTGGKIYYSLDNSNPLEKGYIYKKEILLDEIGKYSISAVCVNPKGIISEISKEKYTIVSSAPDKPKVTPDGGTFISQTSVYIEVPENCNAYYTWDGTNPNMNSELYTEELIVPEGNNVLSVVLINDKGKLSDIYKGRFEYYNQELDSGNIDEIQEN